MDKKIQDSRAVVCMCIYLILLLSPISIHVPIPFLLLTNPFPDNMCYLSGIWWTILRLDPQFKSFSSLPSSHSYKDFFADGGHRLNTAQTRSLSQLSLW